METKKIITEFGSTGLQGGGNVGAILDQATIKKSAILMLSIVFTVIASWEIYLQSKGITPSYNDDAPLWTNQRARVYESPEKAIVFIGSSRIKYDLDIPTWEQITGKHAIQLAMTGSNPRPVLENLANDINFKGNLVIDVTEFIFFSDLPFYAEKPSANIKYFKERTPAQRASLEINHFLESKLVFLDKEQLSINAKLNALRIKNREGIKPPLVFPFEFERTNFDEQAKMTAAFVTDTAINHKVINIWHMLMSGPPPPPMPDSVLLAICTSVKNNIDKIKARGGHVVFIRTPSSGAVFQGEKMGLPREKFWNRLLKETNCEGFYFADYPILANMICPEESHLSPEDAIVFTKQLITLLSETKVLNSSTAKTN